MRRGVALFAGVLALAVAGCGGGGGSEATDSGGSGGDAAASTPTKAALIARGNAICAAGERAIDAKAAKLARESGSAKKSARAQQEETTAKVIAPGVRRQAEEIAALVPSDSTPIDAMVAAVKKGAKELESDPGKLFSAKNPLTAGAQLAQAYGFTQCGGI